MQPASIKQGSEIPYQVSRGENGATSVEFKEAVLGMEVTPTVLQQNRVRLKLRISENTPGQVLQQENGEVLAIDKQEIETQVEVNSGETLALGGIFSQKTNLPATVFRYSAIFLCWVICFAGTGKIMSDANWLSSLPHGFWQCIRRFSC
nr:outer membrane porin HofQ [Raoultella sp. NCTC 9187]